MVVLKQLVGGHLVIVVSCDVELVVLAGDVGQIVKVLGADLGNVQIYQVVVVPVYFE